jgi:hypothetical protein
MMDEYLGDGVYASFDGYQVNIWMGKADIRIQLTPPVLRKLDEYRERINERMQEHISQMEASHNE